jgi:hypothetical protein
MSQVFMQLKPFESKYVQIDVGMQKTPMNLSIISDLHDLEIVCLTSQSCKHPSEQDHVLRFHNQKQMKILGTGTKFSYPHVWLTVTSKISASLRLQVTFGEDLGENQNNIIQNQLMNQLRRQI